MDTASLAASLVAAKLAQVQLAVAGRMARMDAQSGQSVANLISAPSKT
jgi:hypothetical protein